MSPRNENLPVLAKFSWNTEMELFPVAQYFTWKLEFFSNILWMNVKSFTKFMILKLNLWSFLIGIDNYCASFAQWNVFSFKVPSYFSKGCKNMFQNVFSEIFNFKEVILLVKLGLRNVKKNYQNLWKNLSYHRNRSN